VLASRAYSRSRTEGDVAFVLPLDWIIWAGGVQDGTRELDVRPIVLGKSDEGQILLTSAPETRKGESSVSNSCAFTGEGMGNRGKI